MKFKVGDRVRVNAPVYYMETSQKGKGVVVSVNSKGRGPIRVSLDGQHGELNYKPHECTRLKIKSAKKTEFQNVYEPAKGENIRRLGYHVHKTLKAAKEASTGVDWVLVETLEIVKRHKA